ncbi:hypothetical protein IFM89_029454 [Coptis chinensis]|uniref:RRM domain-containing protein n=1 Tax=Coptis chinensis TaxID=261450 RepID=A0A835HVI5_9MAGN|nr:hypothetical protein IFM89_029454 [Coptis chinensis]
MAEESSERGGDADYDITRDPLARVFGKDKGKRTRGYSSCMSNKQVQKFAITEALLEQESSSNSKLENELSEGILENMRHNGSTNGQPCMHTTEVDSTSVHRTQQVPNLNPPSRLSSNPNVKILGRKGEHVANGYVKSDSKKCHFRDIVGDEKVVYVTNVLVGDAPVYDGPQDDIAYLRDIATGGFLIWAGVLLEWDEGIAWALDSPPKDAIFSMSLQVVYAFGASFHAFADMVILRNTALSYYLYAYGSPCLSTSYAWSNSYASATGPPPIPRIYGVPPVVRLVIPIVAPTKKPQTTVYVGKIASTVENDFILTLLRLCGPVKSWKRAQDPSNETPRGFGFCEFESAEEEYNVDDAYKKINMKKVAKSFKEFKHHLRVKYYDKYHNDVDRKRNCPTGVKLEEWEKLVDNEPSRKLMRTKDKATREAV